MMRPQKTLIICHSPREYDPIEREFGQHPAYHVIWDTENFAQILAESDFAEIVLMIKDKICARQAESKLCRINKHLTIFDVSREDQLPPGVRRDFFKANYQFVIGWLRNIGHLRAVKREIIDQIMERG